MSGDYSHNDIEKSTVKRYLFVFLLHIQLFNCIWRRKMACKWRNHTGSNVKKETCMFRRLIVDGSHFHAILGKKHVND